MYAADKKDRHLVRATACSGQYSPPPQPVVIPELYNRSIQSHAQWVMGTSEKVCPKKVAVTEWAVVMLTVQESVPQQSPLHPAKFEPVAGVAVRVTEVP